MIRDQKARKSTHFKTRTGCVTCKARRIKCDEGRPECRKCKATGRQCDYQNDQEAGDDAYEIVAFQRVRSGGSSSGILRRLDSFNQFSSSEELRFLGFFLYQTAYVLDGFTQPDLWNRAILQMSYCEPAIRHLMLSLASLHELYSHRNQDPSTQDEHNSHVSLQRNYVFALQHQNKAISLVRERIATGKPPLAYILAACALFMCIEMLRGETDSAISHLKSGSQLILARYANRELNSDTPAIGRVRGLEKRCSIEKSFIILFSKLAVIQTLYGLFRSRRDQGLAIHIEDDEIYRPFENDDDVVEATTNLMSSVMSLENTIATDTSVDPETLRLEQFQLGRRLYLLKSNFENFVARQQASYTIIDEQHTRRWSLLRMYYILATIWTETGAAPSQMIYDKYNPEFKRVTLLAEDVLGSQGSVRKPKQPFSLDLGVLSVLYITSMKCRDPIIRRRAIELLYMAPRLEGQGDALMLAKVANKLVSFEEQGFEATPDVPLPPETNRVYDFSLEEINSGNRKIVRMNMLTRPGGLFSDIVLVQEVVEL